MKVANMCDVLTICPAPTTPIFFTSAAARPEVVLNVRAINAGARGPTLPRAMLDNIVGEESA